MHIKEYTFRHTYYRIYAWQQIDMVSFSNKKIYKKRSHIKRRKNIHKSVRFIKNKTIRNNEG